MSADGRARWFCGSSISEDRDAIAKRLQSDCKAIAKRLQSDCKAIANRLQIDCKAIAESDCKAIADSLQIVCKAITNRFRTERSVCVKKVVAGTIGESFYSLYFLFSLFIFLYKQ
jgi:hypothetical protein